MKIAAIIPSEEARQTAGVRIRYGRLAPELARDGHALDLTPIDAIRSRTGFGADVYLFSKTYDARAPLLARLMRAAGRRVGLDVFDDYFSQTDDPRLVHMRRWFRDMAPALDFALCATPAMAERLAGLAPGLPCHVVNDPADAIEPEAIGRAAEANAARARATRTLDIGWFGIGDNPYFSVGLEDLHAFSGVLAGARRLGYGVRLSVLTNARALTVERLEMLARLPVEVRLGEWDADRERALVAASLACFLPVNAQAFSTVKSLNRGVTALAGGAQILSAGYPLYASLEEFVYRDLGTLVRDLEAGGLKLRAATAARAAARLSEIGDARAEAAGLVEFLGALPVPRPQAWPIPGHTVAVIHGSATTIEIHKGVRALAGLSVGTPQSSGKLNYDVRPVAAADGKGVDIELSERAMRLLRKSLAGEVREAGNRDGRPVFRIPMPRDRLPNPSASAPPKRSALHIAEIARYGESMYLTRAALGYLFDRPETFVSERAAPYWDPAEAEPADNRAFPAAVEC